MTVVDSLTFPGSGDIQSHPSAALLYLAAPDSGVVWVARSDTLALQDRWPVGGVPRSVAVGVAWDELYVANAGGTLDVLALATGTPLSSINVGESVVAVSVTESGVYAVAPTGTVYKMSPISTSVVDELVTGGIPGRIRAVGDSSVHVVLNGLGWVDFLWGF
jgi:DNA-binding beta-propeller fold protein YncE